MSFGCGIHGMILTQGKSTKNSMPIRAACIEAGEERASKTENLDRSRSRLNAYDFPPGCGRSGTALAEYFENRFSEYCEERAAAGKRRPSKLTNLGVMFTVTPNEEEAAKWDDATRAKFYADAGEAIAAWNYGVKPAASCVHRDEGSIGTDDWPFDYGTRESNSHGHYFDPCLTEDGRYAVGETFNNPTRKKELHEVFVREMRARGWDIDEHLSPSEHAERGQEKQSGRSANEHARTERAARRNRAKAAKLEAATKAANDAVDKSMQAADAANERAKEHADAWAELIDETKKASQERTELAEERSAALQAQADAETGAFRAALAQTGYEQAAADADYEAEAHRAAIAKAKEAEAEAEAREKEAEEAKRAAEDAKAETEKQRADIIRQAQEQAAKVRADAQTEAETARAEAKGIRTQARAEGLEEAKRRSAEAIAKLNERAASVADRIAAADVYAQQARAEAVDAIQSPTTIAMAWLHAAADAWAARADHPWMQAVAQAARVIVEKVENMAGNAVRADIDARAREVMRADARAEERKAQHTADLIAGRVAPTALERACGETRDGLRGKVEKKADDITRSAAWRDAQVDAPHGGREHEMPDF